jgi:hypothetical protein
MRRDNAGGFGGGSAHGPHHNGHDHDADAAEAAAEAEARASQDNVVGLYKFIPSLPILKRPVSTRESLLQPIK